MFFVCRTSMPFKQNLFLHIMHCILLCRCRFIFVFCYSCKTILCSSYLKKLYSHVCYMCHLRHGHAMHTNIILKCITSLCIVNSSIKENQGQFKKVMFLFSAFMSCLTNKLVWNTIYFLFSFVNIQCNIFS